MRKTIIVISLTIVLTLQGCIVKSVHPFFLKDDVVYMEELIGNWRDQEKNSWTIHQNKLMPNSYELHCTSRNRAVTFAGNLFRLDDKLYIDLFPTSDNSEEILMFDMHLMPTHSVARVEIKGTNEIVINWFNEEWLRQMFVQNRIRIAHERIVDDTSKDDDALYLLTAPTEELRKFIVKYGDEALAASDSEAVKLRLNRIE